MGLPVGDHWRLVLQSVGRMPLFDKPTTFRGAFFATSRDVGGATLGDVPRRVRSRSQNRPTRHWYGWIPSVLHIASRRRRLGQVYGDNIRRFTYGRPPYTFAFNGRVLWERYIEVGDTSR